MIFFSPRGIGLTTWSGDGRRQAQIRRRFMLLGQTLEGMRVWDIRRACQALRLLPLLAKSRLEISGVEQMAANILYAALFEPGIDGVMLGALPRSHRVGPDYLNVLRLLDVPQAVAMAAERSRVRVISEDTNGWDFPNKVGNLLGWDKEHFSVQPPPAVNLR